MRYRSLILLLLLSSCGSPAVRYHTLAVERPQTTAPVSGGPPLRVGEVNLPPVLDRQALVWRTSPTNLNIDQEDLWASSLDQMIQQVLTADLTARLGANRVLAANDPNAPSGTRTVTLAVRQFMADSQGNVVLDVDWVTQGGSGSAVTHHATISAREDSTKPDAVVATMSRALGLLADQIAGAA